MFYGEHDWSRFDSPDYPKRVKPRQDHFFDHLDILILPRNLVAVQFGCAGAELPKPMTPGSRVFDVISATSLRNLIFYLIKSWIPPTESVGSLKLRVVKVNVLIQPLAL